MTTLNNYNKFLINKLIEVKLLEKEVDQKIKNLKRKIKRMNNKNK